MAKAEKTAKADKAKGAPQMSTVLDAPKPDKDRAPREDNIGKKERVDVDRDINAEDEGKDKVYGVASRARWGGNAPIAELAADASESERLANENQE